MRLRDLRVARVVTLMGYGLRASGCVGFVDVSMVRVVFVWAGGFGFLVLARVVLRWGSGALV
jgi:hypothetical protein